MLDTNKSVENALKDVHIFLNHPSKSGRMYATYDKEGVKSALKVLWDVVNVLENQKNETHKLSEEYMVEVYK